MRLERTRMLFGDEAMERLARSRVLLFGLGGVGGSLAEALARSGVGTLHLVDNDTVEESNLNRQLFATRETIGMRKTEAAALRLRSVSDARIILSDLFYMPGTRDEIDFSAYDYVIDAIDTVAGKLTVITNARAHGVPVISCLGTGNKTDPGRLRIGDLYETSVCPLARVMRRECRRLGVEALKVLYSTEPPRPPAVPAAAAAAGRRSVPASCAFVPPAAGLMIAAEVVRHLIGDRKEDAWNGK